MKKNYLKFAAFAIMMALTACTTEVIVVHENESDSNLTLGPGEDVIRISMTNTSSTRAARPISNSVADNNINRIAFKFLTSSGQAVETINLVGVIDPVTGKSIDNYTVDGNVLKLNSTLENTNTINIKFSNLGKNTSYRIIAYGYNNEGDENKFPYTIEVGKKDDSGDYLLKCEELETKTIEEIFSGATSGFIGVNQHGKFEKVPNITMKRQVAALLAYFKKAPVFVNNERVKKITVSTKVQTSGFYFPAALLKDDDFNGIGKTTTNSEWIDYLSFDMKKASNYEESDAEYNSGDTYKFDKSTTGKNFLYADGMTEISELECKDNTLFGSCFLLPFPNSIYLSVEQYKCATLNICYWKETDTNTYELITSIPLKKGTNATEGENLSNDSYQYNIRCNNFYSIGTKRVSGLENDETGTDDETNKDDIPISIDEPTGWDYATVNIDEGYEVNNDLFN